MSLTLVQPITDCAIRPAALLPDTQELWSDDPKYRFHHDSSKAPLPDRDYQLIEGSSFQHFGARDYEGLRRCVIKLAAFSSRTTIARCNDQNHGIFIAGANQKGQPLTIAACLKIIQPPAKY